MYPYPKKNPKLNAVHNSGGKREFNLTQSDQTDVGIIRHFSVDNHLKGFMTTENLKQFFKVRRNVK